LAIFLAIIFGMLYFRDRSRGGYKVVKLTPSTANRSPDHT
jgi:hypothetical protein